ncbi:MAG TPA: IS30 family transposase [Patescibacteria group bacterium]|nr:IS30 family transposase [Patescibacteria group bacterium]
MKTHKKLTSTERTLLAAWKEEGLSNKECGRRLGRDVSTIGRELKRNGFKNKAEGIYIYEPLNADAHAKFRQQKAYRAKQPLKNRKVFSYVMEKLMEGWSPEQIEGRLKYEHPKDLSWHISYETIYQYIYAKENKEKKLFEYLRRKQKRRRKKQGRKSQRVRIPDRVSIHARPKRIERRRQFGHWEGDSIVGKGHISGLHTEYERVSSFIRFERLLRITTDEAMSAAKRIFGELPAHARLSTTLDNGKEHTNHSELKTELQMQIYFADPYSSWQRGGNENANLWIRYYFPKKTNFGSITNGELKDVEWELNNRPRKRLKFKTPQEVFDFYLNNP